MQKEGLEKIRGMEVEGVFENRKASRTDWSQKRVNEDEND